MCVACDRRTSRIRPVKRLPTTYISGSEATAHRQVKQIPTHSLTHSRVMLNIFTLVAADIVSVKLRCVRKTSNFLIFLGIPLSKINRFLVIFGMLNPEKNSTPATCRDLSTSPVRCSHFASGNPKVIFNSVETQSRSRKQRRTYARPPPSRTQRNLACEISAYTGWVKKWGHGLMTIIPSNFNRFQNNFHWKDSLVNL